MLHGELFRTLIEETKPVPGALWNDYVKIFVTMVIVYYRPQHITKAFPALLIDPDHAVGGGGGDSSSGPVDVQQFTPAEVQMRRSGSSIGALPIDRTTPYRPCRWSRFHGGRATTATASCRRCGSIPENEVQIPVDWPTSMALSTT